LHTWGIKGKNLYLLGVRRQRLEYPALKRAVREQQSLFNANVVLIEDKASGTQLIQELIVNDCHAVTSYKPECDKIMRLHAQTGIIESGFVYIPETAHLVARSRRGGRKASRTTEDAQTTDRGPSCFPQDGNSGPNAAPGWQQH
jgi:predicted phage terminase large subunit-like protein